MLSSDRVPQSRPQRPWRATAQALALVVLSGAAQAQGAPAAPYPSPEAAKAAREAQRMQAWKAANPSPPAGDTAPASPPAAAARPAVSSGAAGSILESQQLTQVEPAVRRRGAVAAVENAPPRSMVVGEVQVINMANIARIAIGDGSILKATVVDDAQIVVLPEKGGTTALHVWLKNGREIAFEINVSPVNNDKLVADLQNWVQSVPGVRVSRVGNMIALEGRYPNNEAKTRIKELVKHFPQVMNLVAEKAADADPLQMERMVLLDMRVVEVKRSALEQLGIKWASPANGPTFATNALVYSNTPYRPGSLNAFAPVNTAHPIATYLGFATQLTSALNLLEQKGDAWTLAEPRLSCKSGGEAKFTAGGEIPIPVSTGFGMVEIVYKKYGVLMEFKPEADAEGNISSNISLEVSEVDARNSSAGLVAFTTNRAETQMALKQGEPMIIAGLLREKAEKSSDAIPGLGRLPLLSYIFGSNEKRTEKTELVIIATPRVVTPGSAESTSAVERAQTLADEARQVRESMQTGPILHDGNDPTAGN